MIEDMEDMAEDIDIDIVQDPDQDLVQEIDVEGHNRQMIQVPNPSIHVQQV